MAIATAICTCRTCGKEFEVRVTKRTRAEADNFECWAATHITKCKDCELAEAQAALTTRNAEHNLPPLTGSEKQIAWANRIRDQFYTELEAAAPHQPPESLDFFWAEFRLVLDRCTAARWWIDMDQQGGGGLNGVIYQLTHAKDPETAKLLADIQTLYNDYTKG